MKFAIHACRYGILTSSGIYVNFLIMNLTTPYSIKLKDDQTLLLEPVLDKNADFTRDQELGIACFVNAYNNTPDEDLEEHFKSSEKIADYYRQLIDECDIEPFRAGKLIWIRAFLENELVGWMGLEADFRGKNETYISTFVVDPICEGKGIGEKMLLSITEHWLPETSELNLVVRKINRKALNFFQHFGFLPALDIDHPYIDNPMHCMFMRLTLA